MEISLDFETRSELDLKKVGLYRYARHESTEAICCAYMFDDGPEVNIWTEFMPPPLLLFEMMRSPGNTYHAWNAQMEIEIWKECMHKFFGWVACPPLEQWRCTMAEAAVSGYPQKLDTTAGLLDGPDKLSDGKRLIAKLCSPISKGADKGQFVQYKDNEQDYHDMYRYCRGDVKSERYIHNTIKSAMTPSEYEVWRSVVVMNQRGLPVDLNSIAVIIDRIDYALERDRAVLGTLTDGFLYKPTQIQRMLTFLRGRGVAIENMQEDTVTSILVKDDKVKSLAPDVRKILEIRKDSGKTSVSKFRKIMQMVCEDGTVKGNLRYYGAGPGRHAGLGLQPQNLPRLKLKDPESVLNMFHGLSPEVLNIVFHIISTAVGLIRPSIKAPPGKKFIVSDFHSIESICVPWALGEKRLLDSIAKGLDLYKSQASEMYVMSYEEVDDNKRAAGKIVVLACGYAGGAKVFVEFAAQYGIEFTLEEGKVIVKLFRKSRPKVVAAWKQFGLCACMAMSVPGERVLVPGARGASFMVEREYLTMRLPSGRSIYYPQAELVSEVNRWGSLVTMVKVGHLNSYTRKWEVREMTGALLFQNYIQGTCRDFLTSGQIRLEEAGYPQIGSIHDEAIALTPDDKRYTIGEFNRILSERPHWALDFPLTCNGYEAYRYKKD